MAQLIYTPDEDVKVHEENAIKLICSAFQSHESGLPEWLKNSADAYAREEKNVMPATDFAPTGPLGLGRQEQRMPHLVMTSGQT